MQLTPAQGQLQAQSRPQQHRRVSFRPSARPPTAARRPFVTEASQSDSLVSDVHSLSVSRRHLLSAAVAVPLTAAAVQAPAARADDFTRTSSGLSYLDVREGTGLSPQPGDTCVVHWSGYTKGYQGKRIDNTSVRDEPYEFVLGGDEAIQAFQEAVSTMKVGGIRRVEVPGDKPDLSYPRDRSARFTNELLPNSEGKIYKYRYGPQPAELGGQRALDFVLDNPTLQDFNRTLLYDIKLLTVRKARS